MYKMRLVFGIALLCLCITFCGCVATDDYAKKIDSGLLIGLAKNGYYRTLWIAPNKGKIELLLQKDFILVPYGNDFWKIESHVLESDYPQKDAMDVKYLLCYQITNNTMKNFRVKIPDDMLENERYWSTARLTFIGNKYVSLNEDYLLYGIGAAHPIGDDHSRIVEIKDVSTYDENSNLVDSPRNHRPISLVDVFGDKINPIIEKYKEQPVTDQEKDILGTNMSNIYNYTNDEEWRIIRRNGKWIAQIAKVLMIGSHGTHGIFYDIPLNLPKSFVAYDDLYPNWNTIKRNIPKAIDAVSSPTKDILAVLTPENLLLFIHQNTGIKHPCLVIKLNKDESLVMVHWATGTYVDQWTKKIMKIR